MKKLQELKNKIIDLVSNGCDCDVCREIDYQEKILTLEDVILASKKKEGVKNLAIGWLDDDDEIIPIYSEKTGDEADWKINIPLHKQSEEVLNFLHEILC